MEQLKRVKQEYWNVIFIAAIAVLLFWNFTLNDKVDYLERGFRQVAALESETKALKDCHTHTYFYERRSGYMVERETECP